MREFFKSIFFKILLGIVAIFLGFIIYEASTGNISSPSQFLSLISSPFQKAATAISDGIDNVLDPVINARQFQKENEKLKEQITDLNERLIEYETMKAEYDQLQDIAGLKSVNEDFEMVPAIIVSRNADNFGTFQINKGELHGLSVGDPVIVADSTDSILVGKISSVGKTYAQVMTVTNPNFFVTGYDNETKEAGVINGEISLAVSGKCRMLYLDKNSPIKEGALIITSGSAGVFPASLQIGNVLSLEMETNGISAYAVIKPLANAKDLTGVLVITDFTGKGVVDPYANSDEEASSVGDAKQDSGEGESE